METSFLWCLGTFWDAWFRASHPWLWTLQATFLRIEKLGYCFLLLVKKFKVVETSGWSKSGFGKLLWGQESKNMVILQIF
jgi:hypothetical protein